MMTLTKYHPVLFESPPFLWFHLIYHQIFISYYFLPFLSLFALLLHLFLSSLTCLLFFGQDICCFAGLCWYGVFRKTKVHSPWSSSKKLLGRSKCWNQSRRLWSCKVRRNTLYMWLDWRERRIFIDLQIFEAYILILMFLTLSLSIFWIFFLSRYVVDDEYTSSGGAKFPIKWAAPEVLNFMRFSSKSDVWAFGVLMWEVYTCGKMPYGRMKNPEVVEMVQSGRVLEQPRYCPDYVYSVSIKSVALLTNHYHYYYN